MSPDNWKCGCCGNQNPAGAPLCIRCQANPSAPKPQRPPSIRRFPAWIAALPAIFLTVNAAVQFSRISQKINPGSGKQNVLSCVETYGITLDLSEYYVRDNGMGFPAPRRNETPELSTVVKGMARNNCGEEIKDLRLKFVVHDDAGRKGEGSFLLGRMVPGDIKPFERAWMGRVTFYNIEALR